VTLEDTIAGFSSLLEGGGDDYAESAFYMVGNLNEAIEAGKKLATEFASK